MKFAHIKQMDKRKKADVIVLPYWKDNQKIHPAFSFNDKWPSILEKALETGDFKGKEGEILFLYVEGCPEKRLCLLGLGSKEKATVESFRRCYGSVTKACLSKN